MTKDNENKSTENENPAPTPEPNPKLGTDPGEELVEYTAPLMDIHGESPDIYVSVNGKNCVIKRGETVKIKRKFLEVIRASEAQDIAAFRAKQSAQKQSKTALAEL